MKFSEDVTLGRYGLIRDKARNSARAGHYFEAHILMQSVIEFWLRIYLMCDKKLPSRYWEGDRIRFSSLIDYCELVGLNKNAISLLRAFNNKRNDLVHNCFHLIEEKCLMIPELSESVKGYDDKSVDIVAREAYELAESFLEKLETFFSEDPSATLGMTGENV